MGNYLSSVFYGTWFGRQLPPLRMIITGLDAAGKTTILFKLKLGEVVTTIPTIGFNVETLQTGTETLVAWDVGGRSKIRPLWRHYYQDADALVFVVDSNDPDRMEQAKDELQQHLSEKELRDGVPLLIFCNKQDLPKALPPQEVVSRLGIGGNNDQLGRPFLVVGCIATTGDGLNEGMAWISQVGRTAKEDHLARKEPGIATKVKAVDVSPKKRPLPSKLGFDPSDIKTNPVLQNFRPIQRGTECPFAKTAKLWGVSAGNAAANAEALTEFVHQSDCGKALDGFCIELPPEAAQADSPPKFGEHVSDALCALSDLDPSKESLMRVNYIGARGWRFRFAKADFFITTFAPCYPPSSSRYAFGAGKAFVLLQPELSFLRHNLPEDTPQTEDPPKTIRDKTRLAFRDAGRGYRIPSTTKYPPADHIVKPLYDDGLSIVRWWAEEGINNETKTPL